MTVSSTNTQTAREPLAPITLADVTNLEATLQALMPQVGQPPFTDGQQADVDYADHQEERFARYGC